MPLFKTRSAAVCGIDALPVDVEVDLYRSGMARDFILVQRQGFYRQRSGGKFRGINHIWAGALPIESVELSRTVRLWGFEYISDLSCGYYGMVLAAGRARNVVAGRGRSRVRRDIREGFRRRK